MKLCIFAGTFNPIHKAHLAMAQYVLENFGFDKILFIPAYKPPHKDYDDNMSLHRLEMVKLATQNNTKFEVSDIEFKREGKSYTYLTILEILKNMQNTSLRAEHSGARQSGNSCDTDVAKSLHRFAVPLPLTREASSNFNNNKLSFIIGTDAFKKIETWYETDKLKKLIDFIVFIRENETVNLDYLKEKGYNFQFAKMQFLDVSSTEIRNRIENNKPISDLVTKEVEEYIYKNGLYGNKKMA